MYTYRTSPTVVRGTGRGEQDRFHLRRLLPILLPGLLGLLLILGGNARSVTAASVGTVAPIDVTSLTGEIDASSQHFLTSAISTAEQDGAQALVIQINTPGGDITAMQAMISAELNSTVPVIAYVSPAGAYAASAGAFVTLAAQVAAMAPSTTIGASSPVNSDGSDLDSTMKAKVESVLTTDMTNIQQRYGRNVDLAVRMVTTASSYSDEQAKTQGIIDLQADNLNDLLNQVDGRVITLAQHQQVTLHTAGATTHALDQSFFDMLYSLLINPNVVFLLFIVAAIGIYVEISHPGLILPGVAGAIALLLFLFGAGSLAPNWAGLALMLLALALLIMDVRLPTHGVLTVGAVISLIAGSLLFFNSGGPYQGAQVDPLLVYIAAGLIGCLGLYVVSVVVRLRRTPVTTGPEGMIGATVTAISALTPEGRVSYGGEDWAAVLEPPTLSVASGSELRIVSVDGLCLHVQLANRVLPSTDVPSIGRI